MSSDWNRLALGVQKPNLAKTQNQNTEFTAEISTLRKLKWVKERMELMLLQYMDAILRSVLD